MPITSAARICSAVPAIDSTPDDRQNDQPIHREVASRSGPSLRDLEDKRREERDCAIGRAKVLERRINWFKSRTNTELMERDGPLLRMARMLGSGEDASGIDDLPEFDTTKPSLTFRQASCNVAVLTGGAASLVGAAAVAGTAPIFYGAWCAGGTALAAAASPLVAVYAAGAQWYSESSVTAPLPSRIAKSTKKGAQVFLACVTSPVWAPCYMMFERGSNVKNAVRSINRFPQALAYVKNSTSSTYEIEMRCREKEDRIRTKVEKKFERFPVARLGPKPMIRVRGTRAQDGLAYRTVELDVEALKAEPRFENGSPEPRWINNLFKCV